MTPAEPEAPARRVVSLVPSITETLLAWGVRPVGVTRFCEAPGVPAFGGTKNPDLDAIAALAPDLVVMDKEENRAADAEQLEARGVRVLATDVTSVEGVAPALAVLAAAVGAPEPPSLGALPAPGGDGLSVWVPIWRRPWMTISASTYGSSLLLAAGFYNVCAGEKDPYPRVEPAVAAALGPRYVLAPSEPYKFTERHRAELEQVAPVVFVDGQDLFWWGSRTRKAIERLARLAGALGGG